MAVPRNKDLIAAARALILLAEKTKLDASTEGYETVQTLKDEITLFERSDTKVSEAELALSN
jgi:hypothetical protein